MKISIDKTVFALALDVVSRAIPSKSTLSILSGVLMEASGETLQLTGNNLEIAIQHTVECTVIGPGAVVVEAKLLRDIIHQMPDGEIVITATESKMTIEAGDIAMEIRAMPAKNYPAITQTKSDDKPFEIDSEVFRDMVNGVSFATVEGEDNPILTGVFMNASAGRLDMVAVDGYTMAVRSADFSCDDFRAIIKAKDLDVAAKVLDGNVKIIANDNMTTALLETDATEISLRTLDGEYVKYKNIIPKEFNTTVKLGTRELRKVLERAMLVFEADGKGVQGTPINIHIGMDEMKFTIRSRIGEIVENITVDTDGKPLDIKFDPRKIRDVLRHVGDEEVLLKFMNKEPCVMVPVEGDKFLYLVLPIR